MKKLLLILLCLPMIGFGQEKKIFLIKDVRINSDDIDCFFLQELCENIQEGIGLSFYTTGDYRNNGRRIEVSCQYQAFNSGWHPMQVIYYYRNGNKKSEEIYYGCETEMGPYTTWWENGNLKYKGNWDGDMYAEEWYENGQVKQENEIEYGDGLGNDCVSKAVSYYENGQIKSLFKCEDCDIEEDCPPKKCFSNTGERIVCPCIKGDCVNGNGTYTYTSGNKYVGEFRDGKRNGNGTMTYADGTVETGLWKDDKFIGNIIVCSEKEEIYDDDMFDDPYAESTIIKTCLYKNYKTISTAWANARGVYERQYELFQKQNGSYIKVKNSTLFNQSQNQLLSIINHEIQEAYKEYASYEETKDCFEDMTLPAYTINQLGIDFDDNEISFHVTFGLSNYCRSIDGTIVSYSLTEIQEYLNK